MRISDWSSDVCSSDLAGVLREARRLLGDQLAALGRVEHHLRVGELHPVVVEADHVEDGRREEAVTVGRRAERHLAPLAHLQPTLERHAVEHRNDAVQRAHRSEEHTSELQSLMRISYAAFCLNKETTL